MAPLRESELLERAKQGFRGLGGALLYGTDEEAISALAHDIQKTWNGGEVTVIEAASLRGQSGILQDAVSSASLFGGRGLVVVRGADDQHTPVFAPILAPDVAAAGNNAFLLIAGSLRKASPLRAAAEKSANCAVLAFHQEGDAAQIIRIRKNGAALGLAFEPGAAERLLELCGGNRALVAMELEKLSLLQLPDGKVSVGNVADCCGEQGEADINAMFDALLSGDVAGLDRAITKSAGSTDVSSVLPMLQNHLTRLAAIRAAVDEGLSWDAAFQKAKPPVFFGQQGEMKRLLSSLTLESLQRLQVQMQQVVFQSRSTSPAGDLVAARALLSQALRLSGHRSSSAG